MAGGYGYLHRGVVQARDEETGGYTVRVAALAPGRIMGPFPSMALGAPLAPGTRVALASIGASRDDLVVIGPLPGRVLTVGDTDGLAAALAGKVDDAEFTALDARVDAHDVELTTLDARVDAHDVELTTLDDRVDVHDTSLTDQANRIYAVELNPHRTDRDLYTDVLSSLPRDSVVHPVALTNGTIYLTRVYARASFAASAIRMATAVAGVAGTATVGLYVGSSVTALTQARTGSITLTTLGRVTHTFSSSYTIPANSQVVLALLPLAYTTAPQMGGRTGVVHSTLVNPAASLYTSVTKAGQATLPASVDLTDGTWTATGTSKLWVAVG